MLHFAIDVAHNQALSTNPQKKWNISICEISQILQIYLVYYNKILTLMESGVVIKLCQSFWYVMIF